MPEVTRKTTGRFATREELCAHIWQAWLETPARQADIAKQCRVSEGTVARILNTLEGKLPREAA